MSQSSRSPKDLSGESRALICVFTDVWPLSEDRLEDGFRGWSLEERGRGIATVRGPRAALPLEGCGLPGRDAVGSEYTAEEEAVGPGDAG